MVPPVALVDCGPSFELQAVRTTAAVMTTKLERMWAVSGAGGGGPGECGWGRTERTSSSPGPCIIYVSDDECRRSGTQLVVGGELSRICIFEIANGVGKGGSDVRHLRRTSE